MIKMPKKGFFEGKTKFLSRITDAFETQAGLDALNAHYAAQFWQKAKNVAPELIVAAIKKMIASGRDVTDLNEIKCAVLELKPKK